MHETSSVQLAQVHPQSSSTSIVSKRGTHGWKTVQGCQEGDGCSFKCFCIKSALSCLQQLMQLQSQGLTAQQHSEWHMKADSALRLPTSFGKSVLYEVLWFACLTVPKASWVQESSYAIILLVSPLVSLSIAKFNGMSERCLVVALFSALYVYYFQISCH